MKKAISEYRALTGKEPSNLVLLREEPLFNGCLDYKWFLNNPFQVRTNGSDEFVVGLYVLNQYGLHARPSALTVRTAMKYDCDVRLKNKGDFVNAKSIMGLMTLDASKDSRLLAEAKGPDAKSCLEELASLFRNGFGEE